MTVKVKFRRNSTIENYDCTHIMVKEGILRLEKRQYGYTEHVISIPIGIIEYWQEED